MAHGGLPALGPILPFQFLQPFPSDCFLIGGIDPLTPGYF
jgi:hypothetical protein